jgi:hypothetical protein
MNLKHSAILISMCLAFVALRVDAQSSFGIRAGLLLANLEYNSDIFNEDNRTGVDIALVYQAKLNGGLAIQPEVHFSQMGNKLKVADIKTTLNYIQVPVLFQYDLLNSADGIDIYPMVGPYVGVALSGDDGVTDFDFENDLDRLDYGFHLGAGIDFRLGEFGLYADLRYVMGLANIVHNDNNTNLEIKNQGINIGVGIRF